MFWRLLVRLLRGSRGRLLVALIALISGAAVVSALLNLSFDMQRKLSEEFKTLGANVVVAPPASVPSPDVGSATASLMDGNRVMSIIDGLRSGDISSFAPFLFVVARVHETPVVLTGTWLDQLRDLAPTWKIDGSWVTSREEDGHCLVGSSVAHRFSWKLNDSVFLSYLGRRAQCNIQGILESGDTADDQIFINLASAEKLADLPGRISLVELSLTSTPEGISGAIASLQAALPGLEVNPIREVTKAGGALLNSIRLLVISMVTLILVLTALCVLATIAALAIERRADVGLMKALGGSISRVMRLFVAEVAILAGMGGLLGWAFGVELSRWMGRRVFGAAISARWEILPLTMLLVIAVAVAGSLPLRSLGRVKAAVILRGE
jgi:putative ABC transport system permease protein